MRMALVLLVLVLVFATAWTDAPDGRSARIVDAGHAVTLSCSGVGGLRVEADTPEDVDTIILANPDLSLHMRGRTVEGRFVSEMALEGISALMMRVDGSLRVGKGAGAYAIAWSEAGPVIDRLARGCGAAS